MVVHNHWILHQLAKSICIIIIAMLTHGQGSQVLFAAMLPKSSNKRWRTTDSC